VKLVSRVCENCGDKILGDSPKGLCPACVLETGLGPLADESVAGIDSSAVAPGTPKHFEGGSAKADDPGHSAGVLMDFGDYELLEEIGRGGQGVVYRAFQKSLNRTVALKVIGLGQWATQAHLKRFRREAAAAANLDHPCIVPIYEVGEREGSCYFSMKFIDGGQLDEVARRTPISIRNAAELIAKLARTVHYAHEHGILHRDIKPGNILVDANGEPHLTDFGLARLLETKSTVTHTMDVLGTPSYMAPEQASGHNEQLTSATDVYGLGAVFYQLLTGHPPFAGGTTYETVRLVLETEPRPPRLLNRKIDRDLSTISLKCLEKDPKRRYPSALALAEELERWLKHQPIVARSTGIFTRGRKWVRRNPTSALLTASLVALAAASGWIVWKSELIGQPVTTGIAVLPFENLSEQKDNAVFADGMQDDILTKLAKVANLKVISRTSVMEYRGKRNMRQIRDELRVSHVLEGSVRRTGTRLQMNAQLIDTRTDTHVWAEQYDRDLNDVFAIQSEIAKAIASQLQAKLSPRERAAIEQAPTSDITAFDLYNAARTLNDSAQFSEASKPLMLQAADLLNQAVARDPSFFQAYCLLADTHDRLYFWGDDHTAERLGLAEAALKAAFRLQPDSGEAHLARARHFYWGYRDYDRAREELTKAQRALPNNAQIFFFLGSIDRRRGRWEEAIPNLERAVDLDPRNIRIMLTLGETYAYLRKYGEALAIYDRMLALEPPSTHLRIGREWVWFLAKADTVPVRAVLNTIEAEGPSSAAEVAGRSFQIARSERDPAAAARALANIPSALQTFRAWFEGYLAKLRQDAPTAHTAFTVARAEIEKLVRAQPENAQQLSDLARIDAELGDKKKAIQEGRTACDMLPVGKDAVDGVELITNLARVYVITGEKDLALEQLDVVSKLPGGPSYGNLRLEPDWDPLRGDPRFEKIVEESKKPVALK
jgi:serine/threonine protein kinase/tetratricopeptide (TPR) repeat protein